MSVQHDGLHESFFLNYLDIRLNEAIGNQTRQDIIIILKYSFFANYDFFGESIRILNSPET